MSDKKAGSIFEEFIHQLIWLEHVVGQQLDAVVIDTLERARVTVALVRANLDIVIPGIYHPSGKIRDGAALTAKDRL